CHPRPAFSALRGPPQTLFALVGTELVSLQAGQSPPTRFRVGGPRYPGSGQPQSPGGHRASNATGAQDLELLPGPHRPRTRGRLVSAVRAALVAHAGPGPGALARSVGGGHRWQRLLAVSPASLPALSGMALRGKHLLSASGSGSQVVRPRGAGDLLGHRL